MAFPIRRVLLQIGQFAISYVQNSDRRVGKCLSLSFLSADRNERLRTYRLIAGGRRNKPRPADNHSREREKNCSLLFSLVLSLLRTASRTESGFVERLRKVNRILAVHWKERPSWHCLCRAFNTFFFGDSLGSEPTFLKRLGKIL